MVSACGHVRRDGAAAQGRRRTRERRRGDHTAVVKDRSDCLFGRLEVDSCRPAALGGDLVADLLAFVQAIEAGALDGADMDEDVLAALLRLDEAEALGGIEPLNSTSWHLVRLLSLSTSTNAQDAVPAASAATTLGILGNRVGRIRRPYGLGHQSKAKFASRRA